LPSADVKPRGKVDADIIALNDDDLDMEYERELRKFSIKTPKEVRAVSRSERQERSYKEFRSVIVLVWLFCNFILVEVMLNAVGIDRIDVNKNSDNQRSVIYMAVVLWTVAGLSLIRSVGATWYLVVSKVSCFICSFSPPILLFFIQIGTVPYA